MSDVCVGASCDFCAAVPCRPHGLGDRRVRLETASTRRGTVVATTRRRVTGGKVLVRRGGVPRRVLRARPFSRPLWTQCAQQTPPSWCRSPVPSALQTHSTPTAARNVRGYPLWAEFGRAVRVLRQCCRTDAGGIVDVCADCDHGGAPGVGNLHLPPPQPHVEA